MRADVLYLALESQGEQGGFSSVRLQFRQAFSFCLFIRYS